MVVVTDLLTVARKVDNYTVDATGGGLWTDTTHYRATVPVGKRWFLYGGVAQRDVSATVNMALMNVADKMVHYLATHSAATALVAYPEATNTGSMMFPIPLDVGEYVMMTFGVAQSTGAYATCIVLEVDV